MTGAGRRLKTIGVYLRSRPLQYANDPQSDLDSIVAYTHAVSLRVSPMDECAPFRTAISNPTFRPSCLVSPYTHG